MDESVDPTLERARLLTQVASQAAEDVAMEMKRFLANAEQRRKQIQQELHPPSPPKPIPDPGPGPWEVAVIQGSALVTTKADLRRALKRGMIVHINGKEYTIKHNGELSSQRFELMGDYDGATDFHAALSFPGQLVQVQATPQQQQQHTSSQPPRTDSLKPQIHPQSQHPHVPHSKRFLSKEELPDVLSRAVLPNRPQRSTSTSSGRPRPPLHKKPSKLTSEQSSCITTATSVSPLRNTDLPPRNAAEAEALRLLKQQQEEQRQREAEERRKMSERAAAEGHKQAKKRAKLIMQQLREKRELEQKLEQANLHRRVQAIVVGEVGAGASVSTASAVEDEEDVVHRQEQQAHAERARQRALLRVHQRKEEEEAERLRQEEMMRRQEQERQERSKQLTERHQALARQRVAERQRRLKEQQEMQELLQQRAAEERERAEEERRRTAEQRATELANETRRRIERREREKRRKEQMEQHRIQQLLQDFESSNRRKYFSYLRPGHSPHQRDDASEQSQSRHSQTTQQDRLVSGRRPSSVRASPLPPLVDQDSSAMRAQSEQKQRTRNSSAGRARPPKQFLPHIPQAEHAPPAQQPSPPQTVATSDHGSVVSDDSIEFGSHSIPMNPQDDQYSTVSSMTGFSGMKTHASDRKVNRKKPARPIWRMLEPIPIKPFVEVPKKDDFSNMRNYASPNLASPAT